MYRNIHLITAKPAKLNSLHILNVETWAWQWQNSAHARALHWRSNDDKNIARRTKSVNTNYCSPPQVVNTTTAIHMELLFNSLQSVKFRVFGTSFIRPLQWSEVCNIAVATLLSNISPLSDAGWCWLYDDKWDKQVYIYIYILCIRIYIYIWWGVPKMGIPT